MSEKKKPSGFFSRLRQKDLSQDEATQIKRELDDKAKHSQNPLLGMDDDPADPPANPDLSDVSKATHVPAKSRVATTARVHSMPRASSDGNNTPHLSQIDLVMNDF